MAHLATSASVGSVKAYLTFGFLAKDYFTFSLS